MSILDKLGKRGEQQIVDITRISLPIGSEEFQAYQARVRGRNGMMECTVIEDGDQYKLVGDGRNAQACRLLTDNLNMLGEIEIQVQEKMENNNLQV